MTQAKELGDFPRLGNALRHLADIIDARAEDGEASTSWTAKLLTKGPALCADKVAEEGNELADAIRAETDERVASETADLLYHVFVALRARGIPLAAIGEALELRQGTSGIEEKASR